MTTKKSGFVDLPTTPLEAEAPKDVAPAAPEPAEPEKPPETTVALDVFVAISGRKADQTKGFVRWARKEGLTRLSRVAWEEKWKEYLARPV